MISIMKSLYKSPRGDQRKQILTAKKIKGRTTYLNGLV